MSSRRNVLGRLGRILWPVYLCFLVISCVSETKRLTQAHGEEMRAAFSRYFEITQGEAAYGDAEKMRQVVTERLLERELYSDEGEIRDLLIRYEIKELQVLRYSPSQARILVHWEAWHHNVNIVTGTEGPPLRMELKEIYDFVKEEGVWKADNWEVIEWIWPPLP